MIEAVIFDLGGVVCESPLHVIAERELRTGLEPGSINRVVMDAGPDGAWARRERGEIDFETFRTAFEAECQAAGFSLDVGDLMSRIDRHAVPRPRMLEAVAEVKRTGRKVAAAELYPDRSCPLIEVGDEYGRLRAGTHTVVHEDGSVEQSG